MNATAESNSMQTLRITAVHEFVHRPEFQKLDLFQEWRLL
jgi:hypothetical protein